VARRLPHVLDHRIPEPRALSFVAPSTILWESQMSVLAEIAPSMPFKMRSAASVQPM
jgi:hypothetical protein